MKIFLPALLMVAVMAEACIKTVTIVEDISFEDIVLNLYPGGELLEVSDEPLLWAIGSYCP